MRVRKASSDRGLFGVVSELGLGSFAFAGTANGLRAGRKGNGAMALRVDFPFFSTIVLSKKPAVVPGCPEVL